MDWYFWPCLHAQGLSKNSVKNYARWNTHNFTVATQISKCEARSSGLFSRITLFFFWQYYSISSIICEWLFCRTTMVTWKDWKYGGLLGKTTFSPSSNVCSLKIINTNFLPIIKPFRLSFWFDYFEIVILKWQFLDNNETIFEYLEMIFELYYYDIVILRW